MDPQSYALDATWRPLLRDLGVVSANVLRRAGLPDDLLQRPSPRLPPAEYYRLWDSVEAETGDPLFPLRFCRAFRSESFSPPLFAALCSPNLLVAAQRVAKYKPLIAPMRFDVVEARDQVTVELTWLDTPLTPPVSLVVTELLFCVSFARMGTREMVRPIEVTTTVLPSPAAPYEEFFGARMQRGTKNRLAFTTADAARPFLTSNDSQWAAFEPALRQRLADLDASVTTTKRVRAALLEGLPSGLVTMEAIARKLAVSKRSLQRRIEAEGASFQKVLRETREALAQHYLTKTVSDTAARRGAEPLSDATACRACSPPWERAMQLGAAVPCVPDTAARRGAEPLSDAVARRTCSPPWERALQSGRRDPALVAHAVRGRAGPDPKGAVQAGLAGTQRPCIVSLHRQARSCGWPRHSRCT